MVAEKTTPREWTAKISSATPGQLIVITYELLLDTIQIVKEQYEANDIKSFELTIKRAEKILKELMYGLDMRYEISLELMSLYLYIEKLLIKSYVKQDIQSLEEGEKLLNLLLQGWREAVKEEQQQEEKVMKNSQQIYAGLTYGKGNLNESVMHGKSRGFQA